MKLVENPFVSDFTKSTLRQFGWKDNDPIPADLGEILLKIKETLPVSPKVDVLVDIALLQPAQLAEITAALTAAHAQAARNTAQTQLENTTAGMSESVRAAYEKILREEAAAGPQIVDDRADIAATAGDNQPAVPDVPAAPAAELDAPDKPDEPNETNSAGISVLPFCPRCGWDMRMKFEITPTARDKEDFLSTLLGGTRFKKTYELFGGKIVVAFRGMLADENKLVYRQLLLDQQDQKITTEAEWFVQLMDYRLACTLDTITDNTGKVLSVMPELHDMPFTRSVENPLATALVGQLDFMNKNILAQEVTRRLVATHLRQFQRLLEALEAMALEPSFWNGIE